MENLNAEQVKKALECCKEGKCHNGCPLFDFCEVQDVLAGSSKLCGEALALINSQEQRIGELAERILKADKENAKLYRLVDDKIQENKRLTEENERLRAENTDCILGFTLLENAFQRLEKINEQTEADTVSEIQTRFSVHFGTYTDKDMTPIAEVFRLLDQIAKEMLEGDNGEM